MLKPKERFAVARSRVLVCERAGQGTAVPVGRLTCSHVAAPGLASSMLGEVVSIHQLTAPCFTQMLEALSAQLDKGAALAEAKGFDGTVLMNARLAPDMQPLASQIRFACAQAAEAMTRLTGRNVVEPPSVETLDAAKSLIAETITLLAASKSTELDAAAERSIELSLPNGMTFDMNGFDYVRNWAIPQFYFHIVAAYAILRHNGVGLGKADYVRHMFAHLRSQSL